MATWSGVAKALEARPSDRCKAVHLGLFGHGSISYLQFEGGSLHWIGNKQPRWPLTFDETVGLPAATAGKTEAFGTS